MPKKRDKRLSLSDAWDEAYIRKEREETARAIAAYNYGYENRISGYALGPPFDPSHPFSDFYNKGSFDAYLYIVEEMDKDIE